jgi:hypothetical protein
MQTYVLRIYRCEEQESQQLVGVVEQPGQSQPLAFTNVDELWAILKNNGSETSPDARQKSGVSNNGIRD